MKQEWKDWFIQNRQKQQTNVEYADRQYSFTNYYIGNVPFHNELKEYIFSLSEITKGTDYDVYHVHTWNEGDYFDEHIDNNFRRKWAYVCELQESECGTSLIVEGNNKKEGIFDSNTKHEVPKIKKGTRISLTVFGSTPNQLF
jgi:hypothetical protein